MNILFSTSQNRRFGDGHESFVTSWKAVEESCEGSAHTRPESAAQCRHLVPTEEPHPTTTQSFVEELLYEWKVHQRKIGLAFSSVEKARGDDRMKTLIVLLAFSVTAAVGRICPWPATFNIHFIAESSFVVRVKVTLGDKFRRDDLGIEYRDYDLEVLQRYKYKKKPGVVEAVPESVEIDQLCGFAKDFRNGEYIMGCPSAKHCDRGFIRAVDKLKDSEKALLAKMESLTCFFC
ncbi:hypothetical protein Y032_0218g2414 [Ancylostoma ceylanicum]|uniref:Uncharacterized protein n=1 Tax=Ancylostoma ceylanicum TaxID=53326 RepID=A0A016SJQ9_9BILA|nr:hypothetical protein Y032_0218g2414 [Ancylostoma ceylanicum]